MEVSVVTLPAAEPASQDTPRSEEPAAAQPGLFAILLENARAPDSSQTEPDVTPVEATESTDTPAEPTDGSEESPDPEQAAEILMAALAILSASMSSPAEQPPGPPIATDASADADTDAPEASVAAAPEEGVTEPSPAKPSRETIPGAGQPRTVAPSDIGEAPLLGLVATPDAESVDEEQASSRPTAPLKAFALSGDSKPDGATLLQAGSPEAHAQRALDMLEDLDSRPQATGNGSSKSGQAVARFYGDVEQSGRFTEPGSAAAVPEQATLQTLAEDTVRCVRYLVTRDEKVITVRLVPESLGEMHLEITSVKDIVNVRLVSDNATVRQALDGQLNDLRASLAREGIGVGRVVVAPGMTAHAGLADTPNRPKDSGAVKGRANYGAVQRTSVEPATARSHAARHTGLLNVFV